jgi:hypothetical protein
MLWYAVDVDNVPSMFWSTICDMDEVLDNINFPSDVDGIAQLVDNWAKTRENKHRFAMSMGTTLAIDSFVIKIIKPNATNIKGQEVTA